MDIRQQFDALISEMDWPEIVSTIEDLIQAEMSKAKAEDPPAQLLSEPPSIAPEMQLRQVAPRDEEALHQNITWPQDVHGQGFGCHPRQNETVPVPHLPGYYRSLHPVGYVNGDVVYELQPYTNVTPPIEARASLPNGLLHHDDHRRENHPPHVKKPLNAFMHYRKEQRPIIMQATNIRDSATINTIIGQKWRSLSKSEQERYYVEAEKERLLHMLEHPNWSFKNNYGKQRYRKRRKATDIYRF